MRAQDETELLACIPSLRRYARGLTGDRERADDLVQDTLERAWSRWSMRQRRGEVRAWMFGIMHNHFIDRVRASNSRPEDNMGDEAVDLPDRARQTDQLEVRDLERSLQCLPVEQREVILLIAVEELSYLQAAEVLGIPIGTIMSRLSRGRERLRVDFQGRGNAAAASSRIRRVK